MQQARSNSSSRKTGERIMNTVTGTGSYQNGPERFKYEAVSSSSIEDDAAVPSRTSYHHRQSLYIPGCLFIAWIGAVGYYYQAASTTRTSSLDSASLLTGSSSRGHDTHAYVDTSLGLQLPGYPPASVQYEYDRLARQVDWNLVEQDIKDVLTDSQDWWPADYGNYGALFIRLSWHSCGSYRTSDGRGGCDGGAQRFDPERSWPDNTNLDKARRLLEPIKAKHGNGLSWGDLFALSGTVAIQSMGGPSLGFCAGRLDVQDNRQTIALGPSPEQDAFGHCEVNGACPFPLGQNTLGLIYVNPEGPMGEPDPQGAANTIRDVFGRMDWHGRELVALIGGGHTFGKAHGASTASNGEVPAKCPFAPWNGPTGINAITSGFEGAWTAEPTMWDNAYFRNLINYEWEVHHGPGGHSQWRVVGGEGPQAPLADLSSAYTQDIMMLTTDVALKVDPEYVQYVREFAANETAFAEYFAKAWYKLVTRDMGPIERCLGPNVAAVQRFQMPLPDPPRKLADMSKVARDLHKFMDSDESEAEFVRLAFQCASSFRATDYRGGCNGARIRFHMNWPINSGLDVVLASLGSIKDKHDSGLTWADLIVLAGNVAAERMGSPTLSFCPGRSDATSGLTDMEYKIDRAPESVNDMIELYQRRGQTAQDFIALTFTRFLSASRLRHELSASAPAMDDVVLRGILYTPELRYWADHYASSSDREYGDAFRIAWTRLMNADRFDGPVHRACP